MFHQLPLHAQKYDTSSKPTFVRRPSLTKGSSASDVLTSHRASFRITGSTSDVKLVSPRESVSSFEDTITLASDLEQFPLNLLSNSRRNSSVIFDNIKEEDIKAWLVPLIDLHDGANGDEIQTLPAHLTGFRKDYLLRARLICDKFGVFFSVRLQTKPNSHSNRRYSFDDPDTGKMFATGKMPPIKSKTGFYNMLSGKLARRKELQETPVNLLDNNVPGAWPRSIREADVDVTLTHKLQQSVSKNIIAAKMWHNLVCWEEEIPSYGMIDGEIQQLSDTGKKYYIQEVIPLHRLISRIRRGSGPTVEAGNYELVFANNRYVLFKFNNELFKIKLNLLMPETPLDTAEFVQFEDLDAFEAYVSNISAYHAPLFHVRDHGGSEPEMVWCGENGPITGDADLQVVGKRFDMPRIAYPIFWGENPSDHQKFMNSLILFKKRLECRTAEEFRNYVNTCDLPSLNITDYISLKEFLDNDHYINYMDEGNQERYEYYHYMFMPILEKTIARYTNNPNLLYIVCHSDPYSLIVNTEIDHELAIHAPEDTNQHPGDVGAVLCFSADGETYATENTVSLILAILQNPKLLREQVIGVNPAYLLDSNEQLASLWLDIIRIRCLNAALNSDFEFEMHWETVIKVFSYDSTHGPRACVMVDFKLQEIKSMLEKITAAARITADEIAKHEEDFDCDAYVKEQRNESIRSEIDRIYDRSKAMCDVLYNNLHTHCEVFDTSKLTEGFDETEETEVATSSKATPLPPPI